MAKAVVKPAKAAIPVAVAAKAARAARKSVAAPVEELPEEEVEEEEVEADEPEPQDDASYPQLFAAAQKFQATFAPPSATEDEQTFLKRLVTVLTDIPDEDYDALGETNLEWHDAAVDQVREKQPVDPTPADFAGFVASFKPAKASRKSVANGAAAPAAAPAAAAAPAIDPSLTGLAKARAVAAANRAAKAAGAAPEPAKAAKAIGKPVATAAKAGRAAKAAPVKEAKAPGAVITIRNYIIEHPEATNEQVNTHLGKQGFTVLPSTLGINCSWTRSIMRDLKAMGKLK